MSEKPSFFRAVGQDAASSPGAAVVGLLILLFAVVLVICLAIAAAPLVVALWPLWVFLIIVWGIGIAIRILAHAVKSAIKR